MHWAGVPPSGAEFQAIRYAADPITAANWDDATILTDALAGSADSFTALVPTTSGTLYFAHKSYNTGGGWSALSNIDYWPRFDIYLPKLIR